MTRQLLVATLCFATVGVFSVGLFFLTDYQTRPGAGGEPQLREDLPSDGVFADRDPDSVAVLVFYHPKCPCTRAAMRDLARLTPKLRREVSIYGLAYRPTSESNEWIETDSTRILRDINGARIVSDPDALICRKFGVIVSGHMLVYSERGKLLFSGGITPSRGHEGSCLASDQMLRAIEEGAKPEREWPVFGCAIYTQAEHS